MARKIKFGSYDTAETGGWTLCEWSLSAPVYEQHFIDVPGRRRGPLDASDVLTDGEPVYESRTLTARLETSEGTRLEREEVINTMVNLLDGWRMDIVLPDDDGHYITGRVHAARQYNDQAHASVIVTAVCEPWRYANDETVVTLTAASSSKTKKLTNNGRLSVVPLVVITGGPVSLTFGTSSWSLSAGTYALPGMRLQQGTASLTYSGSGTVKLTYREAVL